MGDTVGDPFKDTSGPSLNILIKLMSLISLTVAPIMSAHPRDWEVWYYGLIPLAIMIVGTYLSYHFFWRELTDVTADPSASNKAAKDVEAGSGANDDDKNGTSGAAAKNDDDGNIEATSLMQGEVEVGHKPE